MSHIPVTPPIPRKEVSLFNGQTAVAGLLTQKAAGAYARPVCIASQTFNTTNGPTLRARAAWAVPADVTTNVRATTLKLRSDLPIILEQSASLGTVGIIRAYADIVLYNSTAESCIVTGMHVYQGDPSKAESKWELTSSTDYIVPPLKTCEIRLWGTIHPEYCHATKVLNTDMNLVFLDCTTQKTGTAPKLLHFSMYMAPISGWDDGAGIATTPISSFNQINPDTVQPYVTSLLTANDALHYQNCGTIAPIDQYTGNGVYGFELNAYYTTRKYRLFMPNTIYDSTSETRGSIWIPLEGLGLENAAGHLMYKIYVSWMQRASADLTLTYGGYWFKENSSTGVAVDAMIPATVTANTNYVVTRMLYLTTNSTTLPKTMKGIAFAPWVQRTGTDNSNVYIYTSQFSAKVIPY